MNENARKALRYLRSGKIPKISGHLRNKHGCCALGAMAHAYEKETGDRLPRATSGSCRLASNTFLSGSNEKVAVWLGLHNERGIPIKGTIVDGKGREFTSISSLNDSSDYSLPEIADIIEANADRIFKDE